MSWPRWSPAPPGSSASTTAATRSGSPGSSPTANVFAYLADVYVLEEHRGRGLGQAIVEAAVEGTGLRRCRWLLHTSDAHTLYERFGFESLTDGRVMGRAAPT